ncbi:MAG: hypothetical protein KAH91_00010 [Thermoplasmatales archaeon]|nr:hypothetical protein [Thermoplasmatales archaeon]
MRSSVRVKSIYILLSLLLLLFSNITLAEESQLDIIITDINDEEISEIYENEHFIVSVVDKSQEGTPYLINVTIEFNGLPYTIDDSAEITLQAPEVDTNRAFVIYATKEGYNSSNKSIEILNTIPKKLDISTDYDVVDGGDLFSVFVKDEEGNPVIEALVGIENIWEERSETDDDGRAWLTAPEDEDTITILAQKDGYDQDEITIRVNIEKPWWIIFIYSPYFPIILAVIFLLIVIIFVNNRQKKSVFKRASEISKEKTMNRYDMNKKDTPAEENKENLDNPSTIKDTVRIKPDRDPKVEEIRISRPRKKKEIIAVEPEEDETEKVIKKKNLQRRDYDWFEGTEDIRYKIDKLTGEVDEDGIDKWYEGVDSLKDKIDEKVKKKDKKKEEDEEE